MQDLLDCAYVVTHNSRLLLQVGQSAPLSDSGAVRGDLVVNLAHFRRLAPYPLLYLRFFRRGCLLAQFVEQLEVLLHGGQLLVQTFDVRVVSEAGTNGVLAGSINLVEQIVVTAPGGAGELHNIAINGRNYTYTSLAGDTAASVVHNASGTATNNISITNAPFEVGALAGGTLMDGLIDDLRVYDVVLSTAQIDSIRQGGE